MKKKIIIKKKVQVYSLMDQFIAATRIKRCISRYTIAKKLHLQNMKLRMDKRYLEIAEEN